MIASASSPPSLPASLPEKRGIVNSIPSVQALCGLHLPLQTGKMLALLGENAKVHLPGPRVRRCVARNGNAAPVRCNFWFGNI